MPLNWLLETIKFRSLLANTVSLTGKEALLSVLAGISTGLLTPNRIGNFVGRNRFVDVQFKRKATFVTLQCNLAQFLATIIFGLICLAFIGLESLDLQPLVVWPLISVLLLLGLLLYFRPVLGIKLIPRFLKTKETTDALRNIDEARIGIKVTTLLLSILRYAVFLTQYYLLLEALYSASTWALIPALAVVFLISTLIPSLLFGKIFVREAAGLFVLSSMGIPSALILLAAFLLWFINLAVPSLIGAWVLIRKS